MTTFAHTEQRLDVTCTRYPRFPRGPGMLVRLIKHIYKTVHDDANALLRPYGINHPEYNLMMMMYGTENGTMLPSELAEAAGEKSANITRLTNELCAKRLMARAGNPADRRKVELTLTPAGLALIDSFLPDVCGLLERQGGQLSEIEQKQLEKLLRKMLNGLADA